MKAFRFWICIFCSFSFLGMPQEVFSKEKIQVPDYVVDISKDNTYNLKKIASKEVKPNEMTKHILEKSRVEIENPFLIQMLNKNRMKNAPFAIGYRAEIYLGEWPIAYHSQNTNVNWYYQKVNINYMDNQSEQKVVCMSYEQEANKEVRGGVTTQLQRMEDVQRMIEVQARKKTGLPLSFYTVVGAGTKGRGLYHVPAKHLGYLTAYVPAIHEEGEVTYAKVYLQPNGNQRRVCLRAINQKKVNAWIPIENHIAFGFDYRSTR